mmetsp:Transcript_29667/g.88003  ORF Transcript_29667/g.88003 Transcript_29667/m.88003 type:complete len:218 (-) Transcript_29667:95-748(-)
MDHDAGVGEGLALSGSSGAEEEGSHRRGHPEAHGRHVAGDVLHGVVDGHAGAHGSSGAVDVQGNVLLGIVVGEVQELGHQDVGDLVVDSLTQQDDPVLQQAGDDVHLTLVGVDHGHADGSRGRLIVRVLPAGIDLRLGFLGHHPNVGLNFGKGAHGGGGGCPGGEGRRREGRGGGDQEGGGGRQGDCGDSHGRGVGRFWDNTEARYERRVRWRRWRR